MTHVKSKPIPDLTLEDIDVLVEDGWSGEAATFMVTAAMLDPESEGARVGRRLIALLRREQETER